MSDSLKIAQVLMKLDGDNRKPWGEAEDFESCWYQSKLGKTYNRGPCQGNLDLLIGRDCFVVLCERHQTTSHSPALGMEKYNV